MELIVDTVRAVEILDSRSRPTLAVTVSASDGSSSRAGVPSGASTGSGEAVELRDGDTTRFGGFGVRQAVENVNGEIADALRGRRFSDFRDVDRVLIELDGTGNKSRLGANAVVGVSMAVARLFAVARREDLWRVLTPPWATPRLPIPHFNVVNGGAHAANGLAFQEFMLAPLGAPDLPSAVRAGAEVYGALRRRLGDAGFETGLGDEGGFAPRIARPEAVLQLLVEAITDAGYETGQRGVAIALDPAANGFYADGTYEVDGERLTSEDMIERYAQIAADFPVWSLEDGLAEGDDQGWQRLTDRLGEGLQLVGDDIFVTNPAVIRKAVDQGIGNAALIKVNQIGTVTETWDAVELCHAVGYRQMVSHRSGETEDSFIADLAVGIGCGQLKSGAPARGERVAKYNRLLEIADAHPLPFGLPAARGK